MASTGRFGRRIRFESWLPSWIVVRHGCEHMFVPRYTEGSFERSSSRPGRWRRPYATSACGRRAATIGRCGAGWTRSGRSRSTTSPARLRAVLGREPIALEDVLSAGSDLQRGKLKQRLYNAGIKQRECELCGQGEEWHGRRMSLILDHINGIADDNRLENLQIVCPNCAATLDTHCGRANRRTVEDRSAAMRNEIPHRELAISSTARATAGSAWPDAGRPHSGRPAGRAAAVRRAAG